MEFRFTPVSGVCSAPGSLVVTRTDSEERGKYRRTVASFVLDTPKLNFNGQVAKPIIKLSDGDYRFYLSGGNFRFLWEQPTALLPKAYEAARKLGYKCLLADSRRLSPNSDTWKFSFGTNGNVRGGHLMMFGCRGGCDGVHFKLGSTTNSYVQHLGTQLGALSVLFESKTFFTRTYSVEWGLPLDHESGKARDDGAEIVVAVLSRDPAEYGPGCPAQVFGAR